MLLQRALALLVTLLAIAFFKKDEVFVRVLYFCLKIIGNNETLGTFPGEELFRSEKPC